MDMNKTVDLYDALVIGGGPAGLSAAVYLARWCRSVAVLDCRRPGRSDWAQTNHNYLGFPDGVKASEIVELGRRQAEAYGARFFEVEVASLCQEEGVFRADGPGLAVRGRAVVLATGVEDRWVQFPGYEQFIGRSLHWCIVCDGFEMQGKRVLVVGNDQHTAEMAVQMLRYTERTTILTNSGSLGMAPETVEWLDQRRVRLVVGRIAVARAKPDEPGMLAAVQLEGGGEIEADHLFSVQGADPNNALARAMGVELGEGGYIQTDTEAKTNVPGVYAAGDVTRLFAHQIATAVHEGGTAANALNYYLFRQDQEAVEATRGQPT